MNLSEDCTIYKIQCKMNRHKWGDYNFSTEFKDVAKYQLGVLKRQYPLMEWRIVYREPKPWIELKGV